MQFRKKNKEAFANFLRAKYEAYTGATTVRSYPYYLLIDPADICNLRCPTCPTGIDNEDRRARSTAPLNRDNRAVMKPEMFDQLIDEMGPYLFHLMLYNWGEPLLNKSIGHFIKKAHAHDIETAMHTNLSLKLSEQRIEEVLSSGLDTLTASIDGFSQESYQIHRVGGKIDLVKKNLEALVEARNRLGLKTRIIYKMLVFGHNEHEIPLAQKYCKEIGVGFAHEEGVVPDQSWMTRKRLKKVPKGLGFRLEDEEVLASTNELQAIEAPVDEEMKQARLDVLFPTERTGKSKHPNFCSWHYGYSVVTAGGSVAPCCSTGKESADFGQISPGTTSFAEVWNNEHFRHVRGAFAGEDLSETANIKTICEPCNFPKFVQQLYSIHDPRVIARFHSHFGQTEPALEEGFRLLGQSRYGFFTRRKLGRGKFDVGIIRRGVGNEQDMSPFVEYYEQHLVNEPTARQAPSKKSEKRPTKAKSFKPAHSTH